MYIKAIIDAKLQLAPFLEASMDTNIGNHKSFDFDVDFDFDFNFEYEVNTCAVSFFFFFFFAIGCSQRACIRSYCSRFLCLFLSVLFPHQLEEVVRGF